MSNKELNQKSVKALKNLVKNIEAENIKVDFFDGDNLNHETSIFHFQVTVEDGKKRDLSI